MLRIVALANTILSAGAFGVSGIAFCEELSAGETGRGFFVEGLLTESRLAPLGLDAPNPRFSWRLRSNERAKIQSAYQVRVSTDLHDLSSGRHLLWDSGKVSSSGSVQQPYSGPTLLSRQRYFWQVRVWDERGAASDWSNPAHWEMALLSSNDWMARWIAAKQAPGGHAAVMFRKQFHVRGIVSRARVYVSAFGVYELHLNGSIVGDQLFAPGWTSYDHRLQYQTYDVTDKIHTGENAVGAQVGDGWYGGFTPMRRLCLLLQIEITYADGQVQKIGSSGEWESASGPIRSSSIYDGETYDARLERNGWDSPGYDDYDWTKASEPTAATVALVAQQGPPVRRIKKFHPIHLYRKSDGSYVADMGQNMVGWVRLRVRGPRGARIVLRHAELLDGRGNLYTENLRSAKQTVEYTLKGGSEESFEPHFTYQGFRYISIEGWPAELLRDDLTGVVVGSDLSETGTFKTSNSLINRLQENIVWSERGNFFDIPTDCPQRDERLGWTGDAQVFAPTAAFNSDVDEFFGKWLKDLALDQRTDGRVPWFVPNFERSMDMSFKDLPERIQLQVPDTMRKFGRQETAGSAGYGDAAVIIPWVLYLNYGDVRVLKNQYDSMVRWVEFERARAGTDLIWDGDYQWGDWSDIGAPDRLFPYGSTNPDLVATAYFAHSVDLLSRVADVLGKVDDAKRYRDLFGNICVAFNRAFVTHANKSERTQTAYVLALRFSLVPEPSRKSLARRLAEDVQREGRFTTGIFGTPGILFALSDNGYLAEAYKLILKTEYPSWLYPVIHGATTMWERWDGIRPDGSYQNPLVNSQNHYMYGAVGAWMYNVIGGIEIDPNEPAYKHSLIHPRPGSGISSGRASHMSPYGMVSSDWSIAGNYFTLKAVVPPNTTATVVLPDATLGKIFEMSSPLRSVDGVVSSAQQGSDVIIKVGSGAYEFRYLLKTNGDK